MKPSLVMEYGCNNEGNPAWNRIIHQHIHFNQSKYMYTTNIRRTNTEFSEKTRKYVYSRGILW